MESGDGVRMKTANPSEKSANARSSLAFDLVRGAFSRRGVALMDSGLISKIKIIQFPENIDKFPTNFDKYLKTNVSGIRVVTSIVSVSYENRFK